jgi:response regulator RpfG family c-di-GMP phosphodiesterase
MSDYRMPGLNGAEFLQMVKLIQPEAVRIVLSASTDFEEVSNAINRAEVFRYVAKPWDAQELKAVFVLAFERHDQACGVRRQLAHNTAEAALSPQDIEMRRLEAEEPGITDVRRDPDGAVYLD